jgi:uncharacterized small protein (DUF1192 family)
MDTEFINAFIAKQRALIDDLLTKNLMAESKVTILEKRIADLSAQIEELTEAQQVKKQSKE